MEAVEDFTLTVVDADVGFRLLILSDGIINECAWERMSLLRFRE